MSDTNTARNQAAAEVKSGTGQANTSGWDPNTRATYESERTWQQKQQEDANKK